MTRLFDRIEQLLVSVAEQQAMPDDTWMQTWNEIASTLATEPLEFWAVMMPGDWEYSPAPFSYWMTEVTAQAELVRLQAAFPRQFDEHYVEQLTFNERWQG